MGGSGGRARGEKGCAFAGAGDGLAAKALHALGEELGGPVIEDETIDQAQLNAQQKDDQAGHEVLIAIEFHFAWLAVSRENLLSAVIECQQWATASLCTGRGLARFCYC